RFDRARHDVHEDRPDDARRGRARGPLPRRQPADRARLLLRRRHARALEAARRPDGRRRDVRVHSCRQPRLRVDRRALPGRWPAGPERRLPAVLRRLLRRRLPDHADRPRGAAPGRRAAGASGQQGRVMAGEGPLSERIALVTGASRGIGAATARALAGAGAHVVITARNARGLEAVEEEIHLAGGTATIAPMDLTEGDAIARLAAAIRERWDR